MPEVIERTGLLLLVVALVAIIGRRLRLPYAAGLVAAGAAMGAFAIDGGLRLTRDLVYTVLLPPLLFEGAIFLEWPALRRDATAIGLLATAGVLLSAAVIAAVMHFALDWQWLPAAALGSLLAATDPVSVIATFRDLGIRGRLSVLVEAESLLNDGTAAVLFTLVVGTAAGMAPTPGALFGAFCAICVGGLLAGAVVAAALTAIAGRTRDPLVLTTLTVVAAYGAFLLAEHFGGSGVLATIVTGLAMRNSGTLRAADSHCRMAVDTVWEFIAFVANSLVFVLIGVQLARQAQGIAPVAALVAIAGVLVARAVAVYGPCALLARSRHPVSAAHQHVLVWGGLRGALALALALSLDASMPRREEILGLAFAVVAFSIFVQATTVRPLLSRLGIRAVARTD